MTVAKHSGILGMRWGIRRQVGPDGRVNRSGPSEDYTNARRLNKKGTKHLSNAELKSYVERMNLETQYAKINKKEASPGRKFVQDILVNSGKTALTTFVSKQMTTGLDKLTTKK